MISDHHQHPNDDAYLTIRELRAGARAQAEQEWPLGSPGGSDKRHEARVFVDKAINVALHLHASEPTWGVGWPD